MSPELWDLISSGASAAIAVLVLLVTLEADRNKKAIKKLEARIKALEKQK